MIVKKMESPVYYRRSREGLPGKGIDARPVNEEKSFDQYLIEAFQGEVVRDGNKYSKELSSLTKENLIRLSSL